jgi:hypothetical protein
VSIMTLIAEKLHLLTPRKPLEVPDRKEVQCLRERVHEQIHEREIATTRIRAATDAQVREAEASLRAVHSVLDKLTRKPRMKLKDRP